MPFTPAVSDAPEATLAVLTPDVVEAVASEVRKGLTVFPKTLSPWLFYDESGSRLFEQITELPEYYLTRTEREVFTAHADDIITLASEPNGADPAPLLTLIELGAGTATKTGILLAAAVRHQHTVVYQPVDVSETALIAATENIRANVRGVTVRCQVADYTSQPLPLNRLPNTRTLALYIGSSIGNFSPAEARSVLQNLRAQLLPGDQLLLGTDLGPSATKTVSTIESAYNDREGITSAFNRNVLTRINRELGSDFDPWGFTHLSLWNADESRIEMHLVSRRAQKVFIPANSAGPALSLDFASGETIHTENSYKYSIDSFQALAHGSGWSPLAVWNDGLFSVHLLRTTDDK